ncbi:TPA: 2-isopropylmalate synthase [Candidatus Avigastranaerophilus faecigallinarum]|nr:2-isopropylmalate synthase [Candidatus Avigastranaerophilus faecigallinarum]
MTERQPFFYDITLRDGNQSLKKPWNTNEKEIIFNHLVELGIQGVEVGFAAASEMDFEACSKLAQIAPDNVVISALARCVENDIIKAAESIKTAEKQRVHTFIAMSPFNMEYVLNKSPQEVRKQAIEGVTFARKIMGKKGEVQFSVEHFGDCHENIDFVIDTLKEVVKAGANVINLPNTVERVRPKKFVDLVEKVYNALPKDIIIAVHNHNDLGMATATTVESYFAGAIQLECALNGLGERAGNTNLYEVAIALHNSGVNVPLNLEKIYETALIVSDMSNVKIYEKAALIGPEALAHRSGIHQDGAIKTKDMQKGAYRPIHPSLIGRKDDEKLGFTSQSGKTAIFEIITDAGYPITISEAQRIAPFAKAEAEKIGELSTRNVIDIYYNNVLNVKGAFKLCSLDKTETENALLHFKYNDKEYNVEVYGNGPVDACIKAIQKAGFNCEFLNYEQKALNMGSDASAMTIMHFKAPNGQTIISRGCDESTVMANLKAIFNGLNIMENMK